MNELFNQDNSPAQDPVAELVGEGKKFASVEDMARGKLEADAYIESLKAELDSLKNTNSKMDELLEAVKSGSVAEPVATSNPTPSNPTAKDTTPSFSPEDIEALVAKKLAETQNQQTREQNSRSVQEALSKAYGEKAREVVTTKMQELGMTEDQVTELAASNPKAFTSLFVGQSPAQTGPRFESTRQVPPAQPHQGKGWSHFKEIRQKEPHRFYSPEVQKEFNEAADAMGDSFFTS